MPRIYGWRLSPMAIRMGDLFTGQANEGEMLVPPTAVHGAKNLRARVERPGLPETERRVAWTAHQRAEVRRGAL